MGSHRVPKGVREKGSPRLERGFKCVEGRKRKIAKSGVSSRCYRIPVDWVLARIVEGGQGASFVKSMTLSTCKVGRLDATRLSGALEEV